MGDFLTNYLTPCPVEIHLNAQSGVQNNNSGYYNDTTYYLPTPLQPPEHYGLYVSLLSMTCPHTFHVVNEYNNMLTVNSSSLKLTPGNYSIAQLLSAISSTLSTFSISCVYSSISQKVTLSSATVFTVSGSLCSLLGITQGSSGNTVASTFTVDMTGQNTLFVLTNISGTNIDTRTTAGTSQILASVPVDCPPGGIIHYSDNTQGRIGVELDGTLATIRVILQDEQRRPATVSIPYDMTVGIAYMATGRSWLQIERPTQLKYEPILTAMD